MGQHMQLAGKRDLHDEKFFVVHNVCEGAAVTAKALVDACKSPGVFGGDEQPVEPVQIFITSRAVYRPIFRDWLIAAQYLFNYHIKDSAKRRCPLGSAQR